MPIDDIDRIYEKLDAITKDLSELKTEFAIHCAEGKNGGWKTYLLFMVSGAVLSQGPAGISLLTKWLGIGG